MSKKISEMTPTGEAPATSELALAYNGANYKINPADLFDSVPTPTYGASNYIWNLTFGLVQFISYRTHINNPLSPKQPYDPTKGDLYFMVEFATNQWDRGLTLIPTPSNLDAIIGGAQLGDGPNVGTTRAFVYNSYLYLFNDSPNPSFYPVDKPLPFLQF
jgi:hypothetical protein